MLTSIVSVLMLRTATVTQQPRGTSTNTAANTLKKSPTIYLKQADASGKPSIKVYDLVERTSGARTAQAPQGVEFATKADLEALAARVDALAAPKTTAKKNAKEDAE